MRHARTADRLQDGIILALVVSALAFAATASRAERDGAWGNVTVVQAPTACANVDATNRSGCLEVAAALAVRR
jgi:hypothetical protein